MNGTKGGRAAQHSADADLRDFGYLRFPEVRQLTGLSRSTLWRMEREGAFPARRKLSARSVGWLASEVKIWTEQRTRVAYAAGGTSE